MNTTFGHRLSFCTGFFPITTNNDKIENETVCKWIGSVNKTAGSVDNRNDNDWCKVIHCDSDDSACKTFAIHCINKPNISSWYFCESKHGNIYITNFGCTRFIERKLSQANCSEPPVFTNFNNNTNAMQPIHSDTTGVVIAAIIATLVILVVVFVIFYKIRHVGIFRKMPEKSETNTTHNQRMPEYNETNENFIENTHTVTNSAYGFTPSELSGSHDTQQQLHVSNPSNVYAKVVKKEDTQPNPAPDRDTNNLCDTENDYHRLNQVEPPITTPQEMNTYDSTHGMLGQCDPTYAKTNRKTTKQLTEGIDHYAINLSIDN